VGFRVSFQKGAFELKTAKKHKNQQRQYNKAVRPIQS
jgi:hypothetical protein